MEKLDIIDKQGKLTNNTATRNEVHQKGLLHHASGLIIVRRINNNWEILSQQRSLNKEKNAGIFCKFNKFSVFYLFLPSLIKYS